MRDEKNAWLRYENMRRDTFTAAVFGLKLQLFVENGVSADRNYMPITRLFSMNLNAGREYNIDFDYLVHEYIRVFASCDLKHKQGAGLSLQWSNLDWN